jgi:hypothetical protein
MIGVIQINVITEGSDSPISIIKIFISGRKDICKKPDFVADVAVLG